MHYGRRYNNFYNDDEATAIFAAIDPGDTACRIVSWTPVHAGGVYVLVIDAVAVARTTATSRSHVPAEARAGIEVWECTQQTRNEDLSFFAAAIGDHVVGTWDEATGSPARYEVYRSETSGVYDDPPIVQVNAGETDYRFEDGPHEDDTLYYLLKAYDAAGNVKSAVEKSAVISSAPEPPTGVAMSHNNTTHVTTITWTPSTSADRDHTAARYGDPVELTAAPDATPSGSSWQLDQTDFTGHREFHLAAVDGDGNESASLVPMVSIDLVAGVQVERPNEPAILTARPVAGGEVELAVAYCRYGEVGTATSIRLYTNDGAGGAMDWVNHVGSTTLTGENEQVLTVTSNGLDGAKTYLCGVRARTADGTLDQNTNTTSVLTDATGPGTPVLTLTVE